MPKKRERADELMSLLLGVMRLMTTHLSREHKKDFSGSSPLHFQVLSYIKNRRDPLMREIAEFLLITPPSATSLVDSMATEGLIKRVPDKRDRRATRLSLTPKGTKFCGRTLKQMTNHAKEMFLCLTEDERQQLIFIYRKIDSHFNKFNK